MGIEASIVIDFESGEDDENITGTISVEMDEEHLDNLDWEGNLKGSFAPDDQPVFIIHHDNTLEILDVKCTDGRVDKLAGVKDQITRVRSLEGLFTKANTKIGLSYYGITDLHTVWHGNIGKLYRDEMYVKVAVGIFPCSCTTTFKVPFEEQWQLTPPSLELEEDETYTIQVVVYVRQVPFLLQGV